MQILSGENYEESRVAAHGLRAVPRQEGARDQVDRPADPGGSPEGHPGHPHCGGGLQGQGPVRQPRQGGRRPRRGQDGHRDPLLHHQGRLRQRHLPPVTRQGPDGRCQEGCGDRSGAGKIHNPIQSSFSSVSRRDFFFIGS